MFSCRLARHGRHPSLSRLSRRWLLGTSMRFWGRPTLKLSPFVVWHWSVLGLSHVKASRSLREFLAMSEPSKVLSSCMTTEAGKLCFRETLWSFGCHTLGFVEFGSGLFLAALWLQMIEASKLNQTLRICF